MRPLREQARIAQNSPCRPSIKHFFKEVGIVPITILFLMPTGTRKAKKSGFKKFYLSITLVVLGALAVK
jgi:hypothetical protein